MKRSLLLTVVLLWTILTPAMIRAETADTKADSSVWPSLLPDSLLIQHAGYAGFAAVGVGYESEKGYFGFDLLYGYTSQLYAGHDVHSLTAKTLWNIYELRIAGDFSIEPYFGLDLIYSPDKELFVLLPEHYPDWYYNPTAIRPALVAGLAVRVDKKWSMSGEYTVLDSELAYYRDAYAINAREMGSFGLNVRYELNP